MQSLLPAQSKNKIGDIYVLTPAGIAKKSGMTQRFLARKLQGLHTLEAEIE